MAIGVEQIAPSAVDSAPVDNRLPALPPDVRALTPGRAGTRQAQIIAMLQRPEGATIAEIVAVTGWQSHSVRGVLSGVLKKKLGLAVTSEKAEGRGTTYKIGNVVP